MNRFVKYLSILLLGALIACGKGDTEVKVTRLSLSETEITLRKGDVHALSVIISPNNASDHHVVWSSSDSETVTVSDGLVLAVKVGAAKVYATTADARKKVVCEVTVIPEYIPVEGLFITDEEGLNVLSGTTVDLYLDDIVVVAPQFHPADATNQNVSWVSSNPMVASVKNGTVRALSLGTTELTVSSDAGGKMASCTIQITHYVPTTHVTGVSLFPVALSLFVGKSYGLMATVYPDNASNKTLVWRSSAPEVASVDAFGKVTALTEGTAIVTVMTKDGGFTASSTVIVSQAGKEGVTNETLYEQGISLE